MANTAAAKKAMRASAGRTARNRAARSAVKTRISRVRRVLAGDREGVAELTTSAVAALDRAASKGILHANNAARRKSRLVKRVNAALAGEQAAEPAKGTRRAPAAAKSAKGAKSTTRKPAARSAKK